ncbi:MAG TPA: hypothetical protein VLX91_01390 [Candidatus Acidoferrales bacterium]|nr:hypothetical protein [Candidatus Acidoferrales bacterium]
MSRFFSKYLGEHLSHKVDFHVSFLHLFIEMDSYDTLIIPPNEAYKIVRVSEKELIISRNPRKLIVTKEKKLYKEYKLDFKAGKSDDLSSKLRLHLVLPVTKMVFTLSCTAAKQERQVAQIRHDAIRGKWAEFIYDEHDYVLNTPIYYEIGGNISRILTLVKDCWKISNIEKIPLIENHTQGGLFNGPS